MVTAWAGTSKEPRDYATVLRRRSRLGGGPAETAAGPNFGRNGHIQDGGQQAADEGVGRNPQKWN